MNKKVNAIRNPVLACGISLMKSETTYLRFLALLEMTTIRRVLGREYGGFAAILPPIIDSILLSSSVARNLMKGSVVLIQAFIEELEKQKDKH